MLDILVSESSDKLTITVVEGKLMIAQFVIDKSSYKEDTSEQAMYSLIDDVTDYYRNKMVSMFKEKLQKYGVRS